MFRLTVRTGYQPFVSQPLARGRRLGELLRFRAHGRRPAGPRRQAFAAYLSFGPAVQRPVALPTHLQLGDLHRAGRLHVCWVERDQRHAPRTALPARVRLTFPSGCAPPLPGPIPVWDDGVVGHVWGLRPT